MNSNVHRRVVSGMRPMGRLHLGDYLGTLRTWRSLQQQHECFFFVADWHALATSYLDTTAFRQRITDTLIDWLAVGVDPHLATLFIQSRVVEGAELDVLLSMCTPVTWLERVAAARAAAAQGDAEQSNRVGADRGEQGVEAGTAGVDSLTLGQLGYPLLQACDILMYRPTHVCLPAEQALHAELARDVARRFNNLFGRETDAEERIRRALKRLGRSAEPFRDHRRAYQERGEEPALRAGLQLLEDAPSLTVGDRERLTAYLEGGGRALLGEPEVLLVTSRDLPGTDGRPMARERGNTIDLRDAPHEVHEKLRTMPTDPARVRRRDPGEPEKCPVWRYHLEFGDDDCRAWVSEGCRSARIGCTECKQRAAEGALAVVDPVREAAQGFEESPEIVRSIVVEGTERARDVARDTMVEVRRAMCLDP